MTCVLLSGGGTAGHVSPALATATALRAASPDLAVEFIGTLAGLESQLVPAAGWLLHPVPAVALPRRLSLAWFRLPWTLLRATRRAKRIIRDRGAVAACVFGGYVSGPLALAARQARIPLILHEQNAIPGVANRIAARWADKVAVSLPGLEQRFPHPERVVLTGNPVRPELADADLGSLRDEAIAAFDLAPDRRTLLAFGGSLGARRINDALLESEWAAPERLQLLHVTGAADHDRVVAAWASREKALAVRCVDFVSRMELAYAAADVVLCRAGASTVAELTVTGRPAVLVPYPHAVADEQAANAKALADSGAAIVIRDEDLSGPTLVAAVEPWLQDDVRRGEAAKAARSLARPDAAHRLAAVVLDAAVVKAA